MSSSTRRLSVNEIKQTCLAALANAGVPEGHAQAQFQLLFDAELRGVYSHGLLRLPRVIERIGNGVCDPLTSGKGEWKGNSLYQVDGCQGLGPVVATNALAALYDRIQVSGIVAAAVRNCDHLGMLAWYAEQVAQRGYLLIALTISEALVHPWGGSEAMLGTNPIAIGVPATPHPFILDMATGLVSMGKIHDHANRRMSIPEGWAVDSQGRPTTDAEAAKTGAIAPFGGAKGYGLGLGFELLVTAMAGSSIGKDVVGTLDNSQRCNKGDVFIMMRPVEGASQMISAYLADIRTSRASNLDSVRVPGDRGRTMRESRAEGHLEIDNNIWTQIERMATA